MTHTSAYARCIRCGVIFSANRPIADVLFLPDANLSEHCGTCWLALTREAGRPLGRTDLPSVGWLRLPLSSLPEPLRLQRARATMPPPAGG